MRLAFVTLGARDVQVFRQDVEACEAPFRFIQDSDRRKGIWLYHQQENLQELHLEIDRELDTYVLGGVRKESEKLTTDAFGPFRKYVQLPLLQPFLVHMEQEEQLPFYWIYLVVTDQEEAHPKDTLHIATLAADYIHTQYGFPFERILKLPIVKNAYLLDRSYMTFGHLFDKVKLEEAERIDLFLQGGIDAINTALLLRCLESTADIYYYRKPMGGQVEEDQFPTHFRERAFRSQLLRLCQTGNYVAARSLVEKKHPLRPYIAFFAALNELDWERFDQQLVAFIGKDGFDQFRKSPFYRAYWLSWTLLKALEHQKTHEVLWRSQALMEMSVHSYAAHLNGTWDWKPAHVLKWIKKTLQDNAPQGLFEANWKLLKKFQTAFAASKGQTIPNELLQLQRSLEQLRGLRNDLMHESKGVTMQRLEQENRIQKKKIMQAIEAFAQYAKVEERPFQNATQFEKKLFEALINPFAL